MGNDRRSGTAARIHSGRRTAVHLRSLGRVLESGGYAHGIALIASVALVSSVIDLPFALYRTFVIEARFGFNRSSLALFFADLAKQAALGRCCWSRWFSAFYGSWQEWGHVVAVCVGDLGCIQPGRSISLPDCFCALVQ